MKKLFFSVFFCLFVIHTQSWAQSGDVEDFVSQETDRVRSSLEGVLERVLKGQRYNFQANLVFNRKSWDAFLAKETQGADLPGIPKKSAEALYSPKTIRRFISALEIQLSLDQPARPEFVNFVKESALGALPAEYSKLVKISVQQIDFRMLSQNESEPQKISLDLAPSSPPKQEIELSKLLDPSQKYQFQVNEPLDLSALLRLGVILLGAFLVLGGLWKMSRSFDLFTSTFQRFSGELQKVLSSSGKSEKKKSYESPQAIKKSQGSSAGPTVSTSSGKWQDLESLLNDLIQKDPGWVLMASLEFLFHHGAETFRGLMAELSFDKNRWILKSLHPSWIKEAQALSSGKELSQALTDDKNLLLGEHPHYLLFKNIPDFWKVYSLSAQAFAEKLRKEQSSLPLLLLLPKTSAYLVGRFLGQLPDLVLRNYVEGLRSQDHSEMASALESFLSAHQKEAEQTLQEVGPLTEMIRQMPLAARQKTLTQLEFLDPQVGAQVKKGVPLFEDLLLLSPENLGAVYDYFSNEEILSMFCALEDSFSNHLTEGLEPARRAIVREELQIQNKKSLQPDWSLRAQLLDYLTEEILELKERQDIVESSRSSSKALAGSWNNEDPERQAA